MLRRILVGAIAVTGLLGIFETSAKAATVTNISANDPNNPFLVAGAIITDQGYTLTYQEDTSFSQDGLPPLSYPTPFSDQASKNFLVGLSNPTTQDFNNFTPGTVTSLPLDFGSAGTGTFQGQGTILSPNGSIYPQNNSNRLFAIGNRSKPVNLPGSTFNQIDFSEPIGALGFAVSIPQGNARSATVLELTKLDGTTTQIGLPVSGKDRQNTISYIDVTAQDLSGQFTKVRFVGDSSRIQTFALENITAASFSQIKKPTPVPEPTSILGSTGALLFGVATRRKFKKRQLG